jgi:DNA end-binding protein Ku
MPKRKSSVPQAVPELGSDDDHGGRPFWSGVLSFGLVSIPVDLLPAQRGSGGALRMLDADGTPLARRFFCSSDEQEVDPEHIVRGYELDDGKLVTVSDEELEALAPKKSREIDLRRFVPRASLDPLYFERSYFLAPGSESGKAYRLLAAVMERSGRAGIATFVMRDREYLVAIFAEGGLLRAETLRFAGEVRSSADVGLPKPSKPDARTLNKMQKAVAALEEAHWRPSREDRHGQALRQLAEAKFKKKQGVVHVREQGADSVEPAIDLMEVLRKSLAESGIANDARSARSKSSRTPARSSTKKGKSAPRRAARAGRRSAAKRPRRRG